MEGIQLIQLPKIVDPRGNLSFIEEGSQIPFPIERTYWIYDVPGGEMRGGMRFMKCRNLLLLYQEVLMWCWMMEFQKNYFTQSFLQRSLYSENDLALA